MFNPPVVIVLAFLRWSNG